MTIAGVAVTVTDDETAGVTVSETTLTVAEGASGAYTVKLDPQPSSDVVITVSSDNTDVTVSPATLTFTTANWSTAQTVTVAAAQDADAVNDAASISHAVDASRSANEYDNMTIAGVAVTVTDDDTAGVSVSETTLTVDEGGNNTYTVKLDAQPASDVVINVTKTGSTDVTVSPATLTFTTSNWNTAQTVTVAAAQDADAVNDAASIAHAVVASRSADEFDAVNIAGVAVTVTDDDTAGVTVSKSTLTVAEGGSGAYTVVLNTQPTSDVVISVTRTGSSDVTLDTDTGTSGNQTTLTFTPANWDTAQTVTVAAAQDADAVSDAASITHAVVASRSADEFDAVTIAGVAVTVTDDESAGVTVSKSTLTVDEGGSGSYTVVLNLQPTSDVVINVTKSGSSDVTPDTDTGTSGNQTTLTFTRANWDTAQTVTVAAAQDADAVDGVAAIAHAVVAAQSANEYDAVTIAGVAVTVTDDDAGGDGVPCYIAHPRGQQFHLHGGPGRPARLRRGDQRNRQRQYGRDGVAGHPDLHAVQLEHGEDGDGGRGPGRRRGERHGRHRPRRRRRPQRQRVRRRDHRRSGRDRHRRRHRRGDRVRHFGDGAGGRQRRLHGGPGRATQLRRSDKRNQKRQPRRNGVSGHADLHAVQLGHGADGDGAGRPGRRRGGRHGVHQPRGGGRPQRQRVRPSHRGRGDGDRRRRRHRRGDGLPHELQYV